jgi:hypothetical protein
MLALLLSSLGLGAAAGQRGALTALLLGAFHYTPWFSLGDEWAWVASPVVLGILGAVALAEILADRMPESAALVEVAAWLPKAIVAFLAVAAVSGTLDASLNALLLSGTLAAGSAVVAERGRVRARKESRALADAGSSGADRTLHHTETVGAVGLTAAALTAPWLVLVLLAAIVLVAIVALLAARATQRVVRRVTGIEDPAEPLR